MKATILLPLYIYPNQGAWDPVYTAIEANPNLDFIVIINPSNGPGGAGWWPNADYTREIPHLGSYSNVRIVGYVHSTYCNRPIEDVLKDVQTYADRALEDEKLQMQGIFVDETPNLYTPKTKQYLDTINSVAWKNARIGGERLMIHNPGTAVNKSLAEPGPDITVVSETSYDEFVKEHYQKWLATSPYDRSQTCYMLNSVPEEDIQDLTVRLRERAAFLFLTSAKTDFYQSFDSSSWQDFVAAMASE
ncbi:hypothetical protein HBH69_134320 [Parastagonospora nodorum]|nr:hypothetical protein HBH69_134320 [Parastagonospora nodorum]